MTLLNYCSVPRLILSLIDHRPRKMQEYIDNGVRLGWLIDSTTKLVEIYRQGEDVEILESPATLSREDVLPEFVLDLNKVW